MKLQCANTAEQQMPVGRLTWKDYPLSKRIAPWKVLLPVDGTSPILTIGLKGRDLASLCRTYENIDVHQCVDSQLEWAIEQGQSLGQDYHFNLLAGIDTKSSKYSLIAINVEEVHPGDPKILLGLLKPGGALALIGKRENLTSTFRLGQDGFEQIRKYNIINKTILLPAEDSRFTKPSFELIRPVKWFNRILKSVYRLLIQFQCHGVCDTTQILVAKKAGHLPYLLDWLGSHLGQKAAELSVRAGWERVLIQVLDENGRVLGYAKVPETLDGERANVKETHVLDMLYANSGIVDLIPRVIRNGNWQGHSILVNPEDGFGPVRYTRTLTPGHLKLLAELGRTERCELTLPQWPVWQEICHWAQQGPFASIHHNSLLNEAIHSCADQLRGRRIPFHFVHGDFTPWNILMGRNGVKVVDWERSSPVGLPFTDLLHFAMARKLLIEEKSMPINEILRDPISFFKIETEFNGLQELLKFPLDVVALAAIYEIRLWHQWKAF
jgi:Phosphotransferase enzyme family